MLYHEAGADEPDLHFDIADLKVEGVVVGVLPGDLNSDGRIDLLVLHRTGAVLSVKCHLSIFYQWEDGSFSTAADQSWEADSLAQAVALEPGIGESPSRILYLRRDGVYGYEYRSDDGGFQLGADPIIDHDTFFVSGYAERLVAIETLCDIDSRGARRITLPDIDRIILYTESDSGRYVPVDSISYSLKTRITPQPDNLVGEGTQRLRQTLTMPRISRGSIGRNGESDFVIMYEGWMEGYLLDEGGFSDQPDVRFDYDLAEDISSQNNGYILRPTLHDLSGNGYSDLIVTRQESQGLSGFKTVLDIYLGPLLGIDGRNPSQRMIFEDALSFFISFIDLEGDGSLEVAVPVVKLGIFDIIRILTTRTLKVTVDIYKMGEDGLYGQKPHYVHEIKAGLDLNAGGSGEVIGKVVNLNGDMLKDLVISLKPDRLSLFLGKGGGSPRFFERKESLNLESFPNVEVKALDLTSNGLDDLIATFQNDSKGGSIVRLYMNRTGN
jgi:hypothetical protein